MRSGQLILIPVQGTARRVYCLLEGSEFNVLAGGGSTWDCLSGIRAVAGQDRDKDHEGDIADKHRRIWVCEQGFRGGHSIRRGPITP